MKAPPFVLALAVAVPLVVLLVPACTPEARAPVEKATETMLSVEEAACLVAEHNIPAATKADAVLACGVAEAAGQAFLSLLELADGKSSPDAASWGDQ